MTLRTTARKQHCKVWELVRGQTLLCSHSESIFKQDQKRPQIVSKDHEQDISIVKLFHFPTVFVGEVGETRSLPHCTVMPQDPGQVQKSLWKLHGPWVRRSHIASAGTAGSNRDQSAPDTPNRSVRELACPSTKSDATVALRGSLHGAEPTKKRWNCPFCPLTKFCMQSKFPNFKCYNKQLYDDFCDDSFHRSISKKSGFPYAIVEKS